MEARLRKLFWVEDESGLGAALSCGAQALLLASRIDPSAIARHGAGLPLPSLFLEVAAGEALWPQSLAAVAPLPAGVLLDTAEPAEIERAAARLSVLEAEHGLQDGALGILARAGDATSILALAARPQRQARLAALLFDEARLAAALRTCAEAEPVATARSLVILAASALGVPAIAGAAPSLSGEAFRAAALRDRADGFSEKLACDPSQLAIAGEAFG